MGTTKTGLAAAVLAVSALVTGCGGGSSSSSADGAASESASSSTASSDQYCSDLKDAQSTLTSLAGANASDFKAGLDQLRSVGEEAPDAVAADWKVVLSSFDDLDKALSDAGLSYDDLDAISKGDVPKGVDPAKLQGLGSQLQSLGSQEFQDAGKAIDEHATSECGITLGGS